MPGLVRWSGAYHWQMDCAVTPAPTHPAVTPARVGVPCSKVTCENPSAASSSPARLRKAASWAAPCQSTARAALTPETAPTLAAPARIRLPVQRCCDGRIVVRLAQHHQYPRCISLLQSASNDLAARVRCCNRMLDHAGDQQIGPRRTLNHPNTAEGSSTKAQRANSVLLKLRRRSRADQAQLQGRYLLKCCPTAMQGSWPDSPSSVLLIER